MKKEILNIGKSLNKDEQKLVNGGCVFCSCVSRYNQCVNEAACSGSQVCHEGRCMCPEDI